MPDVRGEQQRIYALLMDGFASSQAISVEDRWRWLMAAHVVGQMDFKLHIHSHCVMLGYATRMRDWREAAGQLFRLALVPLGHALGRLPAGNIGRATVNAFKPMALSPDIRALIHEARQAVVTEDAQNSAKSCS